VRASSVFVVRKPALSGYNLLLATANFTLSLKQNNNMARPKKTELELMQKILRIRFNSSEYELLEKRAKKSGHKLSSFSREILLNGIVVERLSKEQLTMIRNVMGVANNLNQLVNLLNFFKQHDDVKSFIKKMPNIEELVKELVKIQNV
jgi:hypothetical protein